MSAKTGISWTDSTWNPVRGCSRVSEGCRNCYAERVAARFSGPGQPYEGVAEMRAPDPAAMHRIDARRAGLPRWTGEVRFVADHLADPLRWRRPRRIFVNSTSDLFHEALTNEQIAAVFGVMAACPHTFQVLTKRAKRMREWFEWVRSSSEESFTMQQRGIASAPNTARALLDAAYEYLGKGRKPELDKAWSLLEEDRWPLSDVWLGVSVENQAAADERIPDLLATPAAVHFLSCEPLIAPVELAGRGGGSDCLGDRRDDPDGETGIDWVIAGCESGPGARPCDVAWLRSLRDQCAAASVPFFLKQMTRVREHDGFIDEHNSVGIGVGSRRKPGGVIELPYLDGVQHVEFPASRGSQQADAGTEGSPAPPDANRLEGRPQRARIEHQRRNRDHRRAARRRR